MFSQRTKRGAALSEAGRQSAKQESRPTLQLTCNGTVIQELSLDRPQILIGRTEDNDLTIESTYVSRHHILLIRHGGSTILIDLDSTNGTFVNSRRVSSHVLAHEDVIAVDRHSMFVQYSINYSDPSMKADGAWDDFEAADAVIKKALAKIGNLLEKSDTDVLPALSEDAPTVAGFLDDR